MNIVCNNNISMHIFFLLCFYGTTEVQMVKRDTRSYSGKKKAKKRENIAVTTCENLINCPCKLFHALDSGTFKIFRPGITGPEKREHKSHSFAYFARLHAFTGNILAERLLERFKNSNFDVERCLRFDCDVFYHIKKVQNKLMFPDDLYIFISESIIDTTSSLQMLKNRTVRMCPSLNNRWRQLDLCLSRILH